jgi:hypothetical protein
VTMNHRDEPVVTAQDPIHRRHALRMIAASTALPATLMLSSDQVAAKPVTQRVRPADIHGGGVPVESIGGPLTLPDGQRIAVFHVDVQRQSVSYVLRHGADSSEAENLMVPSDDRFSHYAAREAHRLEGDGLDRTSSCPRRSCFCGVCWS